MYYKRTPVLALILGLGLTFTNIQFANAEEPIPDSAITEIETTTQNVTPHEDFLARLSGMREQIRIGLLNGWLTQAQADYLIDRHADLLRQEVALWRQGYTRLLADDMERQLNEFNIAISDNMKRKQTADMNRLY